VIASAICQDPSEVEAEAIDAINSKMKPLREVVWVV
jgi:hypothetical protein